MKPIAPSDLELSQAVLDALQDPAFLIDVASATLQPMNRAASEALAQLGILDNGSLVRLSDAYPELAGRKLCEHGPEEVTPAAIEAGQGEGCNVRLLLVPIAHRGQPRVALFVRADDRTPPADAFHDALTHLPNRRLFERRIRRAIEKTATGDYLFAVLFVDLDRFKAVNDRFGHVQGDHILAAAAQRLAEAVRPQDMVARRDGDEFLILLDDLSHEDDALGVAQRIIQHLQQPLAIESHEGPDAILVGASVGIATSRDTTAAEDLIARADSAMYQAKALGGSTYIVSRHAGAHRTGKPLPR